MNQKNIHTDITVLGLALALELLELQAAACPLKIGEAAFEGEDLATVAAHIDTADSPELIRAVTAMAVDTIAGQKTALEQELWRTGVRRMLEEKILMDDVLPSVPGPVFVDCPSPQPGGGFGHPSAVV